MNGLVEKSIFILLEAKAKFKNLAVLWSGGKDSTALLVLCREMFFKSGENVDKLCEETSKTSKKPR
ncbi:hypothetical protein A2Z53_01915 [Candidatus Giovannonibacteria bacterium RIFCSPHIGHO2_02_42_15]|uniref:Phosphoadenosine phosphosulphate reductase domain-containing protein n=1 Tax=Candidatus Giovannonibacteria bacterium RIFCSPHIGHO2_02_42_15 TaxID=1798329 RepID=A0A1F5VPV3_9BACT|nr:MAG: hypothetical protein A2Z53_01915 [Candidatus Giovannonibacteria bacterium RIFCSPHIGHO2_02_42_15]